MSARIVIPFRDRGLDPLRAANLQAVLRWWRNSPWPVHVVSDGREGDAQFNRSAAYNRGLELVAEQGDDVVIYTEADMLIPFEQIAAGVAIAKAYGSLVVPFTQYCYLSPEESVLARKGGPITANPTMDGAASMGAVNIVSLDALAAVGGWDESFEGNSYDDNAADRAFRVCGGPRVHVVGVGVHLYHLPGAVWFPGQPGHHLSDADRAATERNAARWDLYQQATTPERIRELTAGGI